jgi:hypothetical protein
MSIYSYRKIFAPDTDHIVGGAGAVSGSSRHHEQWGKHRRTCATWVQDPRATAHRLWQRCHCLRCSCHCVLLCISTACAVKTKGGTRFSFTSSCFPAAAVYSGFLQLLAQLTTVGDISEDAFVGAQLGPCGLCAMRQATAPRR